MNSAASSVTPNRQVEVQRLLASRHDVTVVQTMRRGHATQLALDAAHQGVDVLVVLGGDGTLNEVANGVIGTGCALAPLPGGSTNVFARAVGLPRDLFAATRATLDALDRRSISPIDVGSANGRAFLFHAGVGFDAALVQVVERHSGWKRRYGQLAFVAAGLHTFFRTYDRDTPAFDLRVTDVTGATHDVPGCFFGVCLNTDPYTFVGNRPFGVIPDVHLHGPMGAIGLRSLATGPTLRLLGNALVRQRPPADSSQARVFPAINRMEVTSAGGTGYQVDGDSVGTTHELTIARHPEAIMLLHPPQLSERIETRRTR